MPSPALPTIETTLVFVLDAQPNFLQNSSYPETVEKYCQNSSFRILIFVKYYYLTNYLRHQEAKSLDDCCRDRLQDSAIEVRLKGHQARIFADEV